MAVFFYAQTINIASIPISTNVTRDAEKNLEENLLYAPVSVSYQLNLYATLVSLVVQGRWLLGDEELKTRGRGPQRDI
jgi:hypothetical protein